MAEIINIKDPRVEVYGFPWREQNERWTRLPEADVSELNEGMRFHADNSACCTVRFVTDSPKIGVQVWLSQQMDMSHMPRTGSSGIDLYVGPHKTSKFIGVGYPPNGKQLDYSADFDVARYTKSGAKEFTINLPLYNGITDLNILIEPGSKFERPGSYKYEKPIVFYGSSITHGGCASRPGNCHVAILSRMLDARAINLGFSGSALAEPKVADIICSIKDMGVFVMEYDHNAHHAKYLRETHQRFFNSIRERFPKLDIVLVSKPDYDSNPEINEERRQIIVKTYEEAVAAGDKHVYFIDGRDLFGRTNRDACTVDTCHPNDIGFARMARCMYPLLKEILEK